MYEHMHTHVHYIYPFASSIKMKLDSTGMHLDAVISMVLQRVECNLLYIK